MHHHQQGNFYFKGVKIDNVNLEDVIHIIRRNTTNKAYICATDVGNTMASQEDSELKRIINSALISMADGQTLGVVWKTDRLSTG